MENEFEILQIVTHETTPAGEFAGLVIDAASGELLYQGPARQYKWHANYDAKTAAAGELQTCK